MNVSVVNAFAKFFNKVLPHYTKKCFLSLQTVVIHVFPVKDQLPVEDSGTVRSITVKETEVVYITQSQLHFKDTENPDTDLMYVITRPCFSPGNTRYSILILRMRF